MNLFNLLLNTTDWPARWHCGHWTELHGWVHIVSDLAIWGAYLTIPFLLIYFISRRQDIPFHRIFWLFGAFIFLCGLSHWFEAAMFWWPAYRLMGFVKALTAIISWATVITLIFSLRRLLKYTLLPAPQLNKHMVKRGIGNGPMYLFTMALVILVGVEGLAFYSLLKQNDSTQWVSHTHVVIEAVQDLFSHVKDAETGVRGFVITKDTAYLDPYYKALPLIDQDFTRLAVLTKDNTQQEQKVAELKPLITEKLAVLKSSVAGHRLFKGRGHVLMKAIRLQVGEMIQAEHKLLNDRDATAKQAFDQTIFSLLSAALLVVLLHLLAYYLLNRAIIHRQGAELETQNLNQKLTQHVTILEKEIAERIQAQQQILTLNDQLKEQINQVNAINQELEAFSYSVSHDLRAPLRSLDGFSQALLDDHSAKLNEEGIDFLNRIRNNSQRMAQLIDDLLNLSRLTRGELKKQQTNLSDFANSIIKDLKEQEPNRAADIKITPNLTTEADPRLAYIVLENLLRNAWKFTSTQDKAHIEVGQMTDSKGHTIYYVKDNGVGFDMQYVNKLFGAFQRLHAMNEFPGTGIGLATVQRIIHRHGGTVWAEGELNDGATFYFDFG